MSGYVRIHRSLIGHAAFRNDAEAMAFAWMVLRAAWKPCRVRYKGRQIELNRGQLAISIRDLSEALDRPKGWVERYVNRARDETLIETHAETGVLVITICKYDKYQAAGISTETVDETPQNVKAGQAQDTEQVREELEEIELEPNGSCASSDAPGAVIKFTGKRKADPAARAEFVEAWNDLAGALGLPQILKLTPERTRAVDLRLADYTVDDCVKVLANIRGSPFLRGETGWRGCTFDWVIKKANFQKILEGNYNGHQPVQIRRA